MQTLQQEWTDTLIHLGIQPALAKDAVKVLTSSQAQTPENQHTIQQVWLHLTTREV